MVSSQSLANPTTTVVSDVSPPATMSRTCAGVGCGLPANMQCPSCLKCGAPATFFCGQECFKRNWSTHAPTHARFERAAAFVPPRFRYTGPIRPSYVTPQVPAPAVPRPDYALTGNPVAEDRSKYQRVAPVFTPEQVEGIRAACKLGREVLDLAGHMCVPGALPDDIDRFVHNYIVSKGAYPSPLNYRGFPKSLCISVNEVVCHGIPDMRPLQDGDIINLDVSVLLNGFNSDLNETFTVGTVDAEGIRLIKCAYDAMMASIATVRPGTAIRDLGRPISDIGDAERFGVVRSFCGHGIGDLFHCAPNVPHYRNNKAVGVCKAGMVLTIEPMINEGSWEVRIWPDDWTAVTTDGKRSAQFEHTILVTETGYELLTARTPNSRPLWWEETAAAPAATTATPAASEAAAAATEVKAEGEGAKTA